MENSKQKYALTKRQRDVYDFIKAYIDEHNQPPNFDEIMDAVDLKSKSGVHRLVHGLRERNWIDFLDNRARSITIL